MRPDLSDTLSITDTRIAASLSALGFPWKADTTLSTRGKGELHLQFLFQKRSLRFPALIIKDIVDHYRSGHLAKDQPLHPLSVMMLAQKNYDAMLAVNRSISHRLCSTPGGFLTVLRPGVEQASITQSLDFVRTDDLCLVAALAGVGLIAIGWDNLEAARRDYRVARTGHPVRLSTGELHLHDAKILMQRDPTKEDPLRLRLEVEQPLHPLCLMYDALHHRTLMKAMISRQKPLLLMDEGGSHIDVSHGATQIQVRQAMVSSNATGRVMDIATAHMKSPPINW